jgi:hypothetical protein
LAYTDNPPGNQNWPGNLGLDFMVNRPIVVTGLCAFNSTGAVWDASTNITVGIFNLTTNSQVGSSATFNSGSPGALAGSNHDRCKTLPAPIFLLSGNYSVVAVGFNSIDQNANQTIATGGISAENTGGGLITFIGNGRFDSNTTLDLPTSCGGCSIATNEFEAGSFLFQPAVPPIITKSFGPTTTPKVLQAGASTTLTFSITGSNAAVTGLGFTDNLPSGLIVATFNGLTGNCGGGLITATGGTATINLTGASLAPYGNCTFSVNVTGSTPGMYNNTTGPLTNDQGLTGTPSTDMLNVVVPPTITKSFSDSEIYALYIGTWLNFTITNPANNPITATDIGFLDVLPLSLIVANDTDTPVKGTCGGGAIQASLTIELSGASLAPGSSCTFSVAVLANPYAPSPSLGTVTNTTGNIVAFYVPGSKPFDYAVFGGLATASVDVICNFMVC